LTSDCLIRLNSLWESLALSPQTSPSIPEENNLRCGKSRPENKCRCTCTNSSLKCCTACRKPDPPTKSKYSTLHPQKITTFIENDANPPQNDS
jgi:hypothetical protein